MKYRDKSIVNLSSLNLSKEHVSLLKKGLKFCPTPKPQNSGELREDMDRLHKRLRQIAFYESPGSDTDLLALPPASLPTLPPDDNLHSLDPFKHRKFKLKAGGKGPPGPQTLEAMIVMNEHEFNTRPMVKPSPRNNLTPSERVALRELSVNDNIVIKPADKGSAVVILDRLDYLKIGYSQLSNKLFYRKLDHNPTEATRVEIQNIVEDMYQNGEIDESVKIYLSDTYCRTSQMYFLPKIHKNLNPPPGRPIVSANGCPTEKISQFVDHFLNPTTFTLPSYVKDTTHFLLKLSNLGRLPLNCLLVTMDVTSLYTNINTDIGINAARRTLERTRRDPNLKPSNATLLKLLELVLCRNNFQFNGQNYLQIQGCAMGTKLAVGYANNAMGSFEDLFVYTWNKQPLLYLRFIDDIFFIWQHGEESLLEFITHLNSGLQSIKFTHEVSHTEVTFLDTKVKIINDQIVTDLFVKPTDSHNYLRYDSAHPQRCKDSIPYSQFLRIRRICSRLEDFDRHVVILSTHFLRKKYPAQLLEEAAFLARSKDRSELLQGNPQDLAQTTDDKVFLITTYHPHDHHLRNLVFKNWEVLGRSSTTDFIHQKRLMCGYRRPKNLRDILVRASLPPKSGDYEEADPDFVTTSETAPSVIEPEPIAGTSKQSSITDFFKPTTRVDHPKSQTNPTKQGGVANTKNVQTAKQNGNPTNKRGFPFCNRRDCRYCPLLNKTGFIHCQFTGLNHSCMKKISCRSSNLVYAITCKRCGKQYVGQTLLRLKDRFISHFRDIETGDPEKSVSRHFSHSSHNGIKDMEISVLEFIKKPPRSQQAITIRHRVEKHWTHLLRCLAPIGLNSENPKEYRSQKLAS